MLQITGRLGVTKLSYASLHWAFPCLKRSEVQPAFLALWAGAGKVPSAREHRLQLLSCGFCGGWCHAGTRSKSALRAGAACPPLFRLKQGVTSRFCPISVATCFQSNCSLAQPRFFLAQCTSHQESQAACCPWPML